jgi:hypothetical protein
MLEAATVRRASQPPQLPEATFFEPSVEDLPPARGRPRKKPHRQHAGPPPADEEEDDD